MLFPILSNAIAVRANTKHIARHSTRHFSHGRFSFFNRAPIRGGLAGIRIAVRQSLNQSHRSSIAKTIPRHRAGIVSSFHHKHLKDTVFTGDCLFFPGPSRPTERLQHQSDPEIPDVHSASTGAEQVRMEAWRISFGTEIFKSPCHAWPIFGRCATTSVEVTKPAICLGHRDSLR